MTNFKREYNRIITEATTQQTQQPQQPQTQTTQQVQPQQTQQNQKQPQQPNPEWEKAYVSIGACLCMGYDDDANYTAKLLRKPGTPKYGRTYSFNSPDRQTTAEDYQWGMIMRKRSLAGEKAWNDYKNAPTSTGRPQ